MRRLFTSRIFHHPRGVNPGVFLIRKKDLIIVRLHDPFDDRPLQTVVRPDGREHLLADAHGKPAYIPICSVGNVFILRKAERGV